MTEKKPENLSGCKNIKNILVKIRNDKYTPNLNDWVMIQSHFKKCEECCSFFNKEFLGL